MRSTQTMQAISTAVLAGVIGMIASAMGFAATFPEKSVRLMVGFAPGGADIGGRIVAQKLSELWGQSVVVDNRPGASGNIAADLVAKAPADGYTMLLFVNSYTINTTVYKNLTWDALRDFAAAARYVSSPMVVVANDKLPVKSVRELTDYLKANPGKLSYASPGSGTAPHLVAELYALRTGTKMVHVPYKGSGPAVTGLLGNEVQLSFAAASSVAGFIKDGRLRALAVTTAKRDPQFPDLPTIEESGVSGFDADIWYGLVVPAKTPAAIVKKISTDVGRVMADADTQTRMRQSGLNPTYLPAEQMAELMRRDVARWREVATKINLALD